MPYLSVPELTISLNLGAAGETLILAGPLPDFAGHASAGADQFWTPAWRARTAGTGSASMTRAAPPVGRAGF
jgi:hypothetical protein